MGENESAESSVEVDNCEVMNSCLPPTSRIPSMADSGFLESRCTVRYSIEAAWVVPVLARGCWLDEAVSSG